MCFHVQLIPKTVFYSVFEKDYELILNYGDENYHLNGFDHPYLPVITSEAPFKVQMYRWGLIPSWANKEKADELQNMTLNATSEGIFDKASFKGSALKKRCIILVGGFFENRHEQKGKAKYPYFIYPAEKKALMLGGLYNEWTDRETGEVIPTCSIVTTPANILLEKIHNTKKRMPLVLDDENAKKWLDTMLSREQVEEIMKPCPEDLLASHTISRDFNQFNRMNTNYKEITNEVEYPELRILDS